MKQLTNLVPPQNIEAEQELLGAMLLGKEVDIIPPDFFYQEAHKIIYSAILELNKNTASLGEISLVAVAEYLNANNQLDEVGGPVYLASLTDIIPGHVNVKRCIKIIKEKAARRKIIGVAEEAASLAYDGQEDVNTVFAQWMRQQNDILTMLGTDGSESIDMGFDELLSSFIVNETHLECLNKAIVGLPNDITIVGARTSMGKTSLTLGFLQQIALKDRRRVAYFGAGVTELDIYFRLLSAMCQIKEETLKKGNTTKEQRSRLIQAHESINDAPTNIYTTSKELSTVDIIANTRALAKKSKEEMGAVIIENLQQLFWPEEFKSRKEELDVISAQLKALSLDLNIPIIISSQIKREVADRKDKRPQPSDLSGSGDIESLARLVLLLYWDGYYSPDEISNDENGWVPAEIAVYKGGRPTITHLKFNPSFLAWEDA